MASQPLRQPRAVRNTEFSANTSEPRASLLAGSYSHGDLALSAGSAALDTLKNVLEAFDTLPIVKYLAGVGIKILETVDELQVTEKGIRSISIRANDIVLAVAQVCQSAKTEANVQLEKDLSELIKTMEEILRFTKEMAGRPAYKKLFYKSQDTSSLVALDAQLTHAFQVFEIKSSLSLRFSQQSMLEQYRSVSSAPVTHGATIANQMLDVVEGLYLIRSVSEGRVIEAQHAKPSSIIVHAYAAPLSGTSTMSAYQLWVVFRRDGVNKKYTIRNFATGAALDASVVDDLTTNRVMLWWPHGRLNQAWEIIGSRRSQSTDYCVIRNRLARYVLDARCPAGSGCDYLHLTEEKSDSTSPSQEWSLIRFPWATSPLAWPHISPTVSPVRHSSLRRGFHLQNVGTGGFITALNLAVDPSEPGFFMANETESATQWWFMHTVLDQPGVPHEDTFALTTGRGAHHNLATLDHWGQRHISAQYGSFHPSDPHHMWAAMPRDHGFVFRNRASGQILCASPAGGPLTTAPPTSADNLMCQWRLVDAQTGTVSAVLYDPMLSIMPSGLAGTPTEAEPVFASSTQDPTALRTETASAALHRQLLTHLDHEHKVIQDMLSSGCTSLVVLPQLIRAWKDGRVHDVVVRPEEDFVFPRKLKGEDNWDKCKAQ